MPQRNMEMTIKSDSAKFWRQLIGRKEEIRVYDDTNPRLGRDLKEVISEVDDFILFVRQRKKNLKF